MAMKLQSPYPFAERLLLFGGGGVGKTQAVLSIAERLPAGHTMHVLDSDYSRAYERALATDFTDAADAVVVHEVDPEWEPFKDQLAAIVAAGDPETDWLVVDPVSPSWEWVQSWYLEQVYGHDLASHMVQLKKDAADTREYMRSVMEDMNWSVVKKEYAAGVYTPIQRWKGNLILVAEAKALTNQADDDEKMLYGPLGFKPSGEARLKHIAATTLFLDHPRRGVWRMTTVKDRNRVEVDKEPVDDFAADYLVEIAGWERAPKAGA